MGLQLKEVLSEIFFRNAELCDGPVFFQSLCFVQQGSFFPFRVVLIRRCQESLTAVQFRYFLQQVLFVKIGLYIVSIFLYRRPLYAVPVACDPAAGKDHFQRFFFSFCLHGHLLRVLILDSIRRQLGEHSVRTFGELKTAVCDPYGHPVVPHTRTCVLSVFYFRSK